jgi:hypothetical protein
MEVGRSRKAQPTCRAFATQEPPRVDPERQCAYTEQSDVWDYSRCIGRERREIMERVDSGTGGEEDEATVCAYAGRLRVCVLVAAGRRSRVRRSQPDELGVGDGPVGGGLVGTLPLRPEILRG